MINLTQIPKKLVTHLSHRDYKTDLPAFIWFLVRFGIYGCFGMVNELIFTNFLRIVNKVDFIRFFFEEFINMTFPIGVPANQMDWPTMPMFSMTSFWLFFVYGTGIYLVEKLYHLFRKRTPLLKRTRIDQKTHQEVKISRPRRLCYILIRLATYTVVICSVEFLFGWLYYYLFKFFVWEYPSALITTSVAIFPFWFGSSYLVEIIVKKFGESDLEEAFLSENDDELARILSHKRTGQARIVWRNDDDHHHDDHLPKAS